VSLLNGVDVIVFTAGVLERSSLVRKLLLERLAWLGIKIDLRANKIPQQEQIITSKESKVPIIVITTNEELQIAKETLGLIT